MTARFPRLAFLAAVVLGLCGTSRAAPPGEETVRLVFVGDIMLDRVPGQTMAKGLDPFAACADLLEDADLTVGNLECVVATTGARVVKPYNFRCNPRALPYLSRYFNAVSLANNHTGDFGPDGLTEMFDRLDKAEIHYYGAGRNRREAHAPLILERKGVRVALLGYNEFRPRAFEAGPTTPGVAWSVDERVVADIKGLRASGKADLILTFMHWGLEYQPQPSARQKALARTMIDADVVIGGHPHVTEGAESYRGKLIVYSLGNFVFDDFKDNPPALDEACRTSWLLRLTMNKTGLVRWETVVTRTGDDGFPRVVPGAKGPRGEAGSNEITAAENLRP